MNLKYFGTDGIRGIAGADFNENLIKRIATACALYTKLVHPHASARQSTSEFQPCTSSNAPSCENCTTPLKGSSLDQEWGGENITCY